MKLIDKFLFIYSLLFAIVLIIGAILTGFAAHQAVITLFFLPVPLYLFYQAIKSLPRPSNSHRSSSFSPSSPPSLNLRYFLNQTHPLFLLSLSLLISFLTATIIKTTLSISITPTLISPLPQTLSLLH